MIEHPIVLRRLTVARLDDLTPGMRRAVLTGDQLGAFTVGDIDCAAFRTQAADDHVKIFPPTGGDLVLPVQDHGHLDWPHDPPAVARDYTVRSFDAARGELVIDLVTDHDGPGATWARTVEVGATLHVAGPRGSLEHPRDAPAYVLVGDEAALPAIARFLDELPDGVPATAIVVAEGHNVGYPVPADRVRWIVRTDHGADPPELDDALRAALDATPDAFVWVATEYATARRLRRVLRDRGIDRKQGYVTHYWRRDADDRQAAIAEADREMRAMTDLTTPWVLRVAATIGIADAIEDGARTTDEVAARTGTDPAATGILLGYLAARGVVHAAADGAYTLGRTGELLVSDDEHGWRDHLDLHGAPGHMDAALAGLLPAVRTGRSGYQALHGRTFWDALAADARLGSGFDEHLADWAQAWAPDVAGHALWRDVRHVVDVGGGSGTLAASLLAAHPHLRVTVVELAATAARARAALTDRGHAARAAVAEGSFFDPLPAGGDAYVLAQVLHDWPDDDAVRILRRVAEALPRDGRLLIVERLPDDAERGSGPESDDAGHLEMSVLMLTLFGSRERRADDYRALVEAAGLRLGAIHRPGRWLSIIEARPADPSHP